MSNHAIIAGTPKAGTTSLFRYLADHPSICASSIKETNFFINEVEGTNAEPLKQYHSYFQGCEDPSKIFLEASPNYLLMANQVAPLIQEIDGSAKLIFVLRDPVARLLSYYQSNKLNKLHSGILKLGLEEFVTLVEKVSCEKNDIQEPGPAQNALLQFRTGCYVVHLKSFMKYFTRRDIHIIFFDNLADNPQRVAIDTCNFLEINPVHFEGYNFVVENKTTRYRFPILQSSGGRLNRWSEPVLNKHPKVRNILRSILLTTNQLNYQSEIDDKLVMRLREIYEPYNTELCEWLTNEHPKLRVPTWLT